jgi:hypothetical protein
VNNTFREAGDSLPAHGQARPARLRAVATTSCTAGNCPTVYVEAGTIEAGTVVVQGYAVSATDAGIDVPDGEMLVRIPLELLTEAARNLS